MDSAGDVLLVLCCLIAFAFLCLMVLRVMAIQEIRQANWTVRDREERLKRLRGEDE